MQFDNVDKQIVNALFKSGRESLTNLKEIIFKKDDETMSHTGIAKRIAKLEDKGILKVQGNININEVDYKTLFILMEWGNYDEIKDIIKSYSECPRVFLLAQVTGQYNLIMGVLGQNLDVLHRYVNHCGPTNKKGLEEHYQILMELAHRDHKISFLDIEVEKYAKASHPVS